MTAGDGVDPTTGMTAEQARRSLELLFASYLSAHAQVLQVRLIGIADGGREIVRIERDPDLGTVRVVEPAELQQKGKSDYFTATLGLRPGEVHVTPIELNREHGEIETPHVPVIRVATPVFDAAGTAFGIVVINYDMHPLFRRLEAYVGARSQLNIVNPAGDYLIHPDRDRTFGFDLGERHRIHDDLPAIAPMLAANAVSAGFLANRNGGDDAVGVAPIVGPNGVFAYIVNIVPKAVLYQSITTARRSSFQVAGIACLLAVIVAVLVARSLVRPIREAAAAIEAGGGDLAANLPMEGPSEVRILTNAIREYVEHEGLYRSTLESADHAIVTLSLDGKVTSWNDAAERMYGFDADAVTGRPVDMVLPPDRRMELRDLLKRIAAGERVEPGPAIHQTRGGRRISVWLAASPIRDLAGGIVGASMLARDVTAQQRLEEMFRLTVDASPAGMIVADRAGRIVLANIAAETMFAYDGGELVGAQVDDLVPDTIREVHAGLRAGFFGDPHARMMGAGRELRAKRRDGSEFAVEIGLNPFSTSEGSRVLAVIVDVTERKHAEQEMAARTIELERSNEELARFAYVASHDLQEPLRMVSSFCDLLKRKYDSQLDADGREYIDFAVDGARRMQQLIADLLAYSRLSTRSTESQPVSVMKVMDTVQKDLAASIAEAGATIEYDDLPDVMGDPTRVRQVFQNLISNALRFRSAALPVIRISARRIGPDWQYSVIDNGIGIDQTQGERIFGVFQRLHTRDEYPGTGIGLAICKRIVENFGGRIWLGDNDGPGARFDFTIPAVGNGEPGQ